MAPPALIPLNDARPHTLARLPMLPAAPGISAFMVSRSGRHGGVDYTAGDVVLCHEIVRHGDEVVLVARGFGRPRFGRVDGLTLVGDIGERCHPNRWRVAGKVAAVLREEREGWVMHLRQGAGAVDCLALLPSPVSAPAQGPARAPAPAPAPAAQLGLFERAA